MKKAFTKPQTELLKTLLIEHFKGFNIVLIGSSFKCNDGELKSTNLQALPIREKSALFRGISNKISTNKSKSNMLKNMNVLINQPLAIYDEFYNYYRLSFTKILSRKNGQEIINSALVEYQKLIIE